MGRSQVKKNYCVLQEASNTVKIRDEMTNPSVFSFHFRGESEEESNIVAPIVKITPGEKNLKMYHEVRTTRQTQSSGMVNLQTNK